MKKNYYSKEKPNHSLNRWQSFLTTFLLVLIGQFAFSQTVQVGTGTSTTAFSTTTVPITNYDFSYCQMIITEAQITAANSGNAITGEISKLRFYTTVIGTTANWAANWTIYLGSTTKTAFSSNSDWEAFANLQQVYQGSVTPVANNWWEISFTTPFDYTGGNLIVAIDENSAGWSSGPTFRTFTSGANSALYFRADGAGNNPDPANPPLVNGNGALGRTGTLPQMQFYFTEPCVSPSGITATPAVYSANISWSTVANATEYEWIVVANDAGTDATPIATGVITGTSDVVSGLTASTPYDLYVKTNCGVDGLSSWSSKIDFTTNVACPMPTAGVATTLLPDSATIQWTSAGTTFDINWGTGTFTAGAGINNETGVSGTTFTFPNNLTQNTTYRWFVRLNCNSTSEGTSTWAGPFTFTTPGFTSIPYNESFLATTTPTGWLNSGYTIAAANASIGSPAATKFADGATNIIRRNPFGSSVTGNFSLISVGTVAVGQVLTFDYKLINYADANPPAVGSGRFKVEVSTDYGNTYAQIDEVVNDNVAGWRTKTYPLDAYAGQFVRVKITDTWTSGDYFIGFDNFFIGTPPTCPNQTGLVVGNITASGADTSWDNMSATGATGYEYAITTSATPPTTGTATLNTFYSASGLTAQTVYYLHVRSSCDDDTYGNWATITFTTIPVNDTCATATALTVGPNFAANPVTSSLLGATTTAGVTPSCQASFGRDVWFTVTVPASGKVTIETQVAPTNSLSDTVIAVYPSCGGAQIICDDDGGPAGANNFMSIANVSGRTPGEVLYVAVWKYEPAAATPTSNAFLVSAYDCSSFVAAPTGDATQTFCSASNPTVANLVATGTALKWYDAATAGTLLTSTTPLVSGNVYYASQTVTCEGSARLAVTVTIDAADVPTFDAIPAVCSGSTFVLLTTSLENITGTWSPAINNTATTTYTFTPDAGQCATTATLTVTVNQPPVEPILECYETATFNSTTCQWEVTGDQPVQPPVVNCWDEFVFNSTTCAWENIGTQPVQPEIACYETASFNTTICVWEVTGTQPVQPEIACYETATFNSTSCQWDVTGTPTTPTFNAIPAVCSGSTFVLPLTSLEGIPGTWSPAINNTATTEYTFTPDAGQCATTATLTVTVNSLPATPSGNANQTYCTTSGDTLASLDVTGTDLVWYDAPNAGNVLPSSTVVTSTTYYVASNNGTCESPRLAISTTEDCPSIDFVNLQWPGSATITEGGNITVYGRIYVGGLTDTTSGQAPGIQAWVGYSSTNSNPNTWTDWVLATFNVEAGNDDEYQAQIGSTLTPGTYYYATRFSLNGGDFAYGGINATNPTSGGSFWDGTGFISGVLTVEPELSNNEFSFANLKLYPNPTKNILYISHTQEISNVEIYNLIGQKVTSMLLNANEGQINMSNLASGAYFVKVTSNNASKTVKVIRE